MGDTDVLERPAIADIAVSLVPPGAIPEVWAAVAPHLARPLEYSHGRFVLSDVFHMLTHQGYQLWIAFDATDVNNVKGAVVSGFREYPRLKALDLVFIGGDDLVDWKDIMMIALRKWARKNDCESIEFTGRAGWAKMLQDHGIKKQWDCYELPMEDKE